MSGPADTTPAELADDVRVLREALQAFPRGWEGSLAGVLEPDDDDDPGTAHVGAWDDDGRGASVITVDTGNYFDDAAAAPIAAYIVAAGPERVRRVLAALEQAQRERDEARAAAEALHWLKDEGCDLRTAGGDDDSDVFYQVIGFWMDKPHERVIGSGCTPLEAIADARKPADDPTRWDYMPPPPPEFEDGAAAQEASHG